MTGIIISGINGKTGKSVYTSALKRNVNVVCGVDRQTLVNDLDCPVYKSFDDVKGVADVIVDFSSPSLLDEMTEYALQTNTALVIATTGYSDEQLKKIEFCSEKIPVFMSSNMSVGVYIVTKICEEIAAMNQFDIEIIERHHRDKKDCPSGTAKSLADAIERGASRHYERIYGRRCTDKKRGDNELGIHSVRGGNLVGEHEVLFMLKDEFITVKHTALSKELFAEGAISAAKFIRKKKKGLYGMKDLVTSEH